MLFLSVINLKNNEKTKRVKLRKQYCIIAWTNTNEKSQWNAIKFKKTKKVIIKKKIWICSRIKRTFNYQAINPTTIENKFQLQQHTSFIFITCIQQPICCKSIIFPR